jgi:hypothetical protein
VGVEVKVQGETLRRELTFEARADAAATRTRRAGGRRIASMVSEGLAACEVRVWGVE